ncbi:TRAP transporter TAXI family solute receptor [Archangium gephyra]|uniref:TRAP transporter TAXI family solute receptor n=1 Tax=Archangium gephyra TaxID=48 RepID=A0AAC8QDS6_9BACT|nr:TRAP-type transport system protein [Archangium gephyra]REG35960.1 TRAP transporter TAXI family solute receptor [Archangium gephyra]
MRGERNVNPRALSRLAMLRGAAVVAVVLAALVAVAWQFVEPAPPHTVVIATGSASGAYHAVARQYAEHFEAAGLELVVRETAGSIENYALLGTPGSGVDVAIVQGGTAPDDKDRRKELVALASLYLEPVWVFYRGEAQLDRLGQLVGRRIAVGAEGSGVRALSLELLAAGGVVGGQSGTTLVDLGGDKAVAALREGSVDAALFVMGPTAPLISELMHTPGVRLMSFEQAHAYARRFRYLSPVTLHRGSLDLVRDLPEREVQLVAPAAVLVARKDVHPAVVALLTEAAVRTHRSGDLLSEPGRFPNDTLTELPVNEQARYYLTHGPDFLRRMLPFWLAALIHRFIVLLIPLFVVLVPLLRLTPPVYRWSIRSRIYRWYARLRVIDERLRGAPDVEQVRKDLLLLEQLEHEIGGLKVPLSYMDEFYDLRLHVGYIRGRLEERLTVPDAPRTEAALKHG